MSVVGLLVDNFPDVPASAYVSPFTFLRAYLGDVLGVHVTAELPPDFDAPGTMYDLPLVHVDRVSGSDLDPVLDRPVMDVDSYADDLGAAEQLAGRVHYHLRTLLPLAGRTHGVVVTRVRTIVGPRILTTANPRLRRFSAIYEIALHPQ